MRLSTARVWIRRLFLIWATFALLWMANSVRTRGVDPQTLRSSANTAVSDVGSAIVFQPRRTASNAALVFVCGSGIAAEAYAPLLRPIAEAGHPVYIVRLPYRFAPLDSHKREALSRMHAVIESRPSARWVVAGHSLGAALAARFAGSNRELVAALVLIGTTHPKELDLSTLSMPVTKVYGTHDGVARQNEVIANKRLLPASTRWVEIEGGNHSQFGHYGWQILDGRPRVSRSDQQAVTRAALLDALREVD